MKVRILDRGIPGIYISLQAYNKMSEFIKQSDKEIGWLGKVTKSNKAYSIEDVYLFEQEVHATTTEITTEGLNNFAMELMSTPDGMEVWNDIKLWGHSHVNMGTTPSGQDETQMKLFEEGDNDFFIRLIANKKGELRIDLFSYEEGIVYEELPYQVYMSERKATAVDKLREEIKKMEEQIEIITKLSQPEIDAITSEIKSKVKNKVTVINNYANNNVYGGYGYGSGYGYQGYMDDFSAMYGGYGKKNEVNMEKDEEVKKVEKVINQLNKEEKFILMSYIESGINTDSILQEMVAEVLTLDETILFEDKIYEYCEENDKEYQEWYGEIYLDEVKESK